MGAVFRTSKLKATQEAGSSGHEQTIGDVACRMKGPWLNFVSGESREGSGKTTSVVDPSRDEAFAELRDATPEDFTRAIGVARRAQPAWGKLPLIERARHMRKIADRLHLSPGQVALAWMLKRSPVMLPIPGTADPGHLAQNLTAVRVELSDEDFQALDRLGRDAWRQESGAA